MKEIRKQLKPLFLTVFGYGLLGSILIFGDQIRRIYKKINKATSTDVLSIDRFQPTFIYIEDPFIQEEIAAGVTLNTERLKLTRFHKWLYDKIEESFIFRNWFSFQKNLAWRYLRLAQDEHRSYRLRAIRSLALLNNLTDSDYQQLAQALDFRTAAGLARSTKNVKFFLDPPNFKAKPDRASIAKKFHDFFLSLQVDSTHSCLQYFVSKVIMDFSDLDGSGKGFDDDLTCKFDNSNFIPMYLEALLHHSWTDVNAKQIVKLGGLPLLTEVYKYLNEFEATNVESLIVLSKLMSNISACTESAQSIFASGWLKLLSILAQHKDIRVSAPAHKALCNFDEDDQEGAKYLRKIFPLHPTMRTLAKPKLDVVFIHGLLGGIFITWRQRDSGICSHKSPLELLGLTASEDERERAASYLTIRKPLDQEFFVGFSDLNNWEKVANSYEFVLSDIPVDSNTECCGPFYGSSLASDCHEGDFTKCWPKDWLANDCPEIRLIGVNYETNISKWTPMCPIASTSGALTDRSLHLMKTLCEAGVGKRPIVWIGHSMGGLIVKGVLSLARASSEPERRSLFDQTKGIVFYSTPHKGSHLAALNPTSQMIVWPSVEVQELRENSPGLLKLHDEFLDMVKEKPFRVISFAERESTYITSLKFEIRFVDANSADPDVGENYGIPLDHLCICKPVGRQSFLYQKVRNLIQETVKEIEKNGNQI